jgi:hypothetical protein
VLQPRRCEAQLVQLPVNVLYQPEGIGNLVPTVPELELPGLDQDPGDSLPKPGSREPLGVLYRPHAGFDAYPDPYQGLHELQRTGLGKVDRSVVRLAPGPHEPEATLGVGLDLGAGRRTDWHAASTAYLLDHLVDDVRLQRLAPLGIARVQVDSSGTRSDAGGSVTGQLLDRDGRRDVLGLRSVAVESRL